MHLILLVAILAQNLAADDWDVFADLDQKRESSGPQFTQSFSLHNALALYSLKVEHTLNSEWSGSIGFSGIVEAAGIFGVRYKTGISTGDDFPSASRDSDYFIRKAAISWEIISGLFITAGMRPHAVGSNLVDNPLNIYILVDPHPAATPAGSMPSLSLALNTSHFTAEVTAVPRRNAKLPQWLSDALRLPYDDFLVLADGSFHWSPVTLKVVAFTRSGTAFGVGGELLWYPGKIFRLGTQYVYSSGRGIWETSPSQMVSDLLMLSEIQDGASQYTHTASISGSINLLSRMEITGTYLFDGGGISAEEYAALAQSFSSQTSEVQAMVEESYRPILSNPEPFLRHRISLLVSVPQITEYWGAFMYAYFAPLDLSLKMTIVMNVGLNNRSSLGFGVTGAAGVKSSVYGQTIEKLQGTVSFETVY